MNLTATTSALRSLDAIAHDEIRAAARVLVQSCGVHAVGKSYEFRCAVERRLPEIVGPLPRNLDISEVRHVEETDSLDFPICLDPEVPAGDLVFEWLSLDLTTGRLFWLVTA